jgi:hypothetical protein
MERAVIISFKELLIDEILEYLGRAYTKINTGILNMIDIPIPPFLYRRFS